MEIKQRPTFDDIFMDIAKVVSKRSTCLRRKVGAVAVLNNQVLASGYNGAPKGTAHCTDKGTCLRQELGIPSGREQQICRGTHAEQNAICQCAKNGQKLDGATLYITDSPCSICAKLIINAGVSKVIYDNEYPDELGFKLLSEAGIEIVRYQSENS